MFTLPLIVSRERLVYFSTAGFCAGVKGLIPPFLGTLDYVRLRGLYHARSSHRVLQIVEGRRVRTVRRPVPLVILDVLQFAFFRHISDIDIRTVFVIRRRTHCRGKSELVLDIVRSAARRLPVGSKATGADVLLVAALAGVGPLVRV